MKKVKLKMLASSLIVLVIGVTNLKSQCLAPNNWDVTSLNSSNNTQSYDIANDAAGNIYMCGTFESATTFTGTCSGGPPVNVTIFGTGTTPKSAYIAKFDCGGKLLWVNFESNSGWSEGRTLVVDPAGAYVFLSGQSNGSLSFRTTGFTPCTSGLNGAAFSTTEYYVARFNTSNGAFVDGYGPSVSSGASYKINSMALKKVISGSVTNYDFFLCGSATFGGTDQNFIVHNARLSSSSGYSLPWAQNAVCIGTHKNQAWDIAYNPTNNLVFLTGDFDFQMQYPIGGIVYTKTAMIDGFICAVNPSSGLPIASYCKNLGANVFEYSSGRALTIGNGGNVFYTGYFTGSLSSFYGFSTSLPGVIGRMSTYVLRTNGTALVWANSILPASTGSCVGMGIATNTGSVYVSGILDGGNLTFPGGGGTYTSPGKRMFIATFNKGTSALLSGNTSKSSNSSSDHQTAKVTCDEFFAYTCGSYKGIFDYTTGSPPSGALTSTPLLTTQNAFIVRNGAGATNPFRLINPEGKSDKELALSGDDIYPNPTTSVLNIQLQNLNTETIVELRDISGKLLIANKSLNSNLIQLNLSELEAGIYLLTITKEDAIINKKIIKQ